MYNYNIQHNHFDPSNGLHTEVGVDTVSKYGWFEQYQMKKTYDHHMCEGGLWFAAGRNFLELIDQDGTCSLPRTVGWILKHYDFESAEDFV